MNLIHDPAEVAKQAPQHQASNRKLKQHLLAAPSQQVDQWFEPVTTSVTAQIDCTQCANCCKKLEAGISPSEITRLADLTSLSREAFIDIHVDTELPSGACFLKKHPCLFLEENRCSIYSHRPEACRIYPGLESPGLKYRLRRVFENYRVCPIVFNTIELLKKQLNIVS